MERIYGSELGRQVDEKHNRRNAMREACITCEAVAYCVDGLSRG